MTATHLTPPDPITILGSGNMGSGIAQAFAQAGFPVRVRDLTEEQLARGRASVEKTLDGAIRRGKLSHAQREEILARITFTTSLPDAVQGSRLVVEAVFEEEAVKAALFRELAPLLAEDTIVATNTSSLSVSRLGKDFPHPGRFAGLHFFYPAPINQLLEIVGGESTSPAVLATLTDLGYRLKKIPIPVKDSAGFVVNRFFVPFVNEAARMAQEGLASLPTIEEVGREVTGSTNGPFEVMNLTGIPISAHAMESLEAAFGPAYDPADLLLEQVKAGQPWLWRDGQVEADRKAAVQARFEGLLIGIATQLVEEGVGSAEAVEVGANVGLKWKHGPFSILNRLGVPAALRSVERVAAKFGEAFPISTELRARAERGDKHWPLRYVRSERHGHIAWVYLDRPAVLNALNSEVLHQLESTFLDLANRSDVRVVVLTGAGPNFCAGADVAEMATKSTLEGRAFGFLGQAACDAIEAFPGPVIAFVQGYALGGGLEVALASDFIVASESAKLGLPEVTIGIHTGLGGSTRLTRQVGRARAKRIVLSGETFSAEEAHQLGFVAEVYPKDEALAHVQALAETIASRAPLAVAWAKAVVNHADDTPLDVAVRLEGESAGHTFSTADRTEGMKAFLERRPPKFEGA